MRSLVFLALLLVGLSLAMVEASKHQPRGKDALAGRFAELEEIKGLDPKHRQLVERALHAFESTIDKSKLDPARKDAVKQTAMNHFMSRLAERKHGH